MSKVNKGKREPIYMRIRAYLLEQIKNMRPGDNRLETEEALSLRFGTSRATIREAMNSLIREGYISRRQGKGNFGHPAVAQLERRIDLDTDFRRLIQQSGREVRLEQKNIRRTTASPQMVMRLPETERREVLSFDWLYSGDGVAEINCRVELLIEFIKEMPTEGETEATLSQFLARHCDVDISYTATWLRSEISPTMAKLFSLPEGTALLVWEEIFHDLYDRKICYNTIHFHPDRMDLSMLTHI